MAYTSINPANGKLIQSIPEHTNSDVEAALSRAHEAFLSWRLESFATRAAVVRKAADLMRERLEELSRMITIEMGKLIAGVGTRGLALRVSSAASGRRHRRFFPPPPPMPPPGRS